MCFVTDSNQKIHALSLPPMGSSLTVMEPSAIKGSALAIYTFDSMYKTGQKDTHVHHLFKSSTT